MKVRDIEITPTETFVPLKTSAYADADHKDLTPTLTNVTISNQTDKTVYIKNSGETTITGTGRELAVGDSFQYQEIDFNECFLKIADDSGLTGKIIITGTMR